MNPNRLHAALALLVVAACSGCASVFSAPDTPGLDDPHHPLSIHRRATEEALRLHGEAHEAAMRAAEQAHAAAMRAAEQAAQDAARTHGAPRDVVPPHPHR